MVNERDRDYWYILGVAAFWIAFLWLVSEAYLEWVR